MIDDCEGIGGCFIAAPGDVTVRAHQDQRSLIEHANRGLAMLAVVNGTRRSSQARSSADGCGAPVPSHSCVKPSPNRSRVERPLESQACGARLPGDVVGRYSVTGLGVGTVPSLQMIGEGA